MPSDAMSDQGKATQDSEQTRSVGEQGDKRQVLRWLGVLGFAAFAVWSVWVFISYQRAPGAAHFWDPRVYPNSLLVVFNLSDYLSLFDQWLGWEAMPLGAWAWWIVALVYLLFLHSTLSINSRGSVAFITTVCAVGLFLLLALFLIGGAKGARVAAFHGVLFHPEPPLDRSICSTSSKV